VAQLYTYIKIKQAIYTERVSPPIIALQRKLTLYGVQYVSELMQIPHPKFICQGKLNRNTVRNLQFHLNNRKIDICVKRYVKKYTFPQL